MTENAKKIRERIFKKTTTRDSFIDAIADELRGIERCDEKEMRERLSGVKAAIQEYKKGNDEIIKIHQMLNVRSPKRSSKD